MRYFFIIYALLAVLVVSIGGFRGEKFKDTPIRIFPDMDEQDRIDAQELSPFFADNNGARLPVENTVPQGLVQADLADENAKQFTNDNSYYHTGMFDEKVFGTGLPVSDLALDEANLEAFIKRGKVVFDSNCAACHGVSGNGKGVVASYGVPGVFNLIDSTLPDGGMFDVIANGRGNMAAFGYQIDLKDRWAVIAYIRSLQYARKAPLEQVKAAYEAAQ
ncbi:c-type cytochrome [Rubritalea marina]|uniref:c-type cytochrome n=1 Tax=Rubritalea marina TaxID=361055 RepID=UPI0003759424|nr:cytochrome c [Rubritalea marina]